LPFDYDYAKYAEAFEDFGTHFYFSGSLGGKFEYICSYLRKQINESGEPDLPQLSVNWQCMLSAQN